MKIESREKKDYSISFVRCIATLMIVACHVMQFYGCILAWWFNVGVQIFLFISGYLYGRKRNVEVWKFYSACIKKILIDYYIYIVVITFVMKIVNKVDINLGQVFELLILNGNVDGLEHFWFLPYILSCYLITPILIKLYNHLEEKCDYTYVLITIVLAAIVEVVAFVSGDFFVAAWINCYILGFVAHRWIEQEKNGDKIIFIILILSCIVFNAIKIYALYFSNHQVGDVGNALLEKLYQYTHILLAIVLTMIFRIIYEKILFRSVLLKKILNLSDIYSYDVYIVHQFYILGAHSILFIASGEIVGILQVCILTIVSAMCLKWLSQKVNKCLIWLQEVWNNEMHRKV